MFGSTTGSGYITFLHFNLATFFLYFFISLSQDIGLSRDYNVEAILWNGLAFGYLRPTAWGGEERMVMGHGTCI